MKSHFRIFFSWKLLKRDLRHTRLMCIIKQEKTNKPSQLTFLRILFEFKEALVILRNKSISKITLYGMNWIRKRQKDVTFTTTQSVRVTSSCVEASIYITSYDATSLQEKFTLKIFLITCVNGFFIRYIRKKRKNLLDVMGALSCLC